MKQINSLRIGFLLYSLFFALHQVKATPALEITYNTSNYAGYNIRCHGGSSGWINIVPVGGTFPYTYLWSNGATTQNLTNIPAGTYSVTVTDASSQTASIDIEMTEPNSFELNLNPTVYEGGYNISREGGSDGVIETEVGGGTTPYTYLWSNGKTTSGIKGVTAGYYSVTVTDQNGCTKASSVTLTEPSALHIVSIVSATHNGFNVSCYEGSDGQINLTVAGGTPPYSFQWSNGNFEEDLSGLSAGTYSVLVRDANEATTVGQIILTAPSRLSISITPFVYNNNYNTSCHNCANGILTASTTGGASPYTFNWETGQNTAIISNLSAGDYHLVVTDANGCQHDKTSTIIAPQRDDWSMDGNSTDSTKFIGTVNATDLVFKTNNIQRMKLLSSGEALLSGPLTVPDININNSLTFGGNTVIGFQPSGTNHPQFLSFGASPNPSLYSIASCNNPALNVLPSYQFNGSIQLYGNSASGGTLNIMEVGFDGANSIIESTGTSTDPTFNRLLLNYYCGRDVFVGNNTSGNLTANQNLYVNGQMGIGTQNQAEKLHVADGSIYIEGENQGLIIDAQSNKRVGFLKYSGREGGIWRTSNQNFEIGRVNVSALPGNPSSFTTDLYIDGDGRIGINTVPATTSAFYKLFVEGGIASREVKVTATGWPDYVFAKDYRLMSIYEYEKFIISKNHLPGMPSAREIEENDGFEIGNMQAKLLEKVEEQALYIIGLQKQIDEMKAQLTKNSVK